MFGIGETELVIIVVFGFLLFGPDKLPGMGRTLGRVLRQFREASDGFTEVVQTNIMDPASEELEKSPKQRRREELEKANASAAQDVAQETEAAPRRETFAERRARLAAEQAAKSEQSQVQTTSVAEREEQDAQPVPSEDDMPSAEPSAAELYAMSGTRKSSRSHTQQDDFSSTTDGEEAGSAEAEA